MSEFTPQELTQLEDALEGDTGPDAPHQGASAISAHVATRLRAYERVSQLAARAWPDEEVTHGVLDTVLAQARASNKPQVAPAPHAPARGAAWRRWLVPGFALAGMAALVFYVVGPESGGRPAYRTLTHDDAAASPSARSSDRRSPAGETTVPAPGRGAVAPAHAAEDGRPRVPTRARDDGGLRVSPGEAESVQPKDRGVRGRKKERERTSRSSSSSTKSRPARASETSSAGTLAPSAAAAAATATRAASGNSKKKKKRRRGSAGTQHPLQRAHALRVHGRCDEARFLYAAQADRGPGEARAQAEAGIALCLEWQGKPIPARKRFQKARSHDSTIDLWIRTERGRMPTPPSDNAGGQPPPVPTPTESRP
ncbi:MAG: hypothetical protein V3V08_03175 [Nannocystaceae bacterium]